MSFFAPRIAPHGDAPFVVDLEHEGSEPDCELTAEQFLADEAEPGVGPVWVAAAGPLYARALIASSGPFFRGGAPSSKLRARLESAGWPELRAVEPSSADALRAECYPAHQALRDAGVTLGSPRPRLVLVGEQEPAEFGLHWWGRAGAWLLAALRELGHDELTVLLTNARGPAADWTDRLLSVRAALDALPEPPTWVALGHDAQKLLRRARIDARGAPHPSYARRYKRKTWGVSGYASALETAGVPVGPWASARALPVPLDAPPGPLVARIPLPPWGGGRTAEATWKRRQKIEAAHDYYVTGRLEDGSECTSVAQAATAAGVNRRHVDDVSTREDWIGDRDAHHLELRRARLARSREVEGRAIPATVRAICDAMEAGARQLAQRIAADKVKVTPFALEALARTLCVLAERGDATDDAELATLRTMPQDQLYRQLLGTFLDQRVLPVEDLVRELEARGQDPVQLVLDSASPSKIASIRARVLELEVSA